ncbi:survival of motor neuron-related-splicing factor 30 [Schistocerca americana]|uniref:survival of motor neuron-related-splicing factor 30 n=1 Tax=Schistocerca americana TaxID=7009 RepID=UPI001F50164A|nr:survival of motor neuron-related-splicing factor 30 [Schistocerca americana]XP_047113208.1 survival of motor neuron-related-splicing factor 30 [Schistocerca piceifrons]XP_049777431.1 survival of motor neuron-related-splicing factor 30 [Schistocerca cancellata]XP_049777432.1 survival of motor neuron-related-splicing factor 30 [Schistocerca cancellata]XP_049809217.1 survival of motor neuron-related-splicing factor 30 [Schistocerca nitens]XP_049858972.1 survival of motor neuron-related-splicin
MADDLQGNLQNYKLQLQQVEAALTTDPDNEELKKLKVDLEEVIELTRDLIKTQLIELKAAQESAASSSIEEAELTAKLLAAEEPNVSRIVPVRKDWKVGDRCLAIWSGDGQYYEATIEDITEDGDEVSVVFDNYKNSEVTSVALLKELKAGAKRPAEDGADSKAKKLALSKQREYQKKKKQKKLQRYKQLEEEREGEKNKWLAFNSKTSKKGMTRKSIFASPDNVNGRVGIGTCGMSGRPMTEFTTAEKWRKGM